MRNATPRVRDGVSRSTREVLLWLGALALLTATALLWAVHLGNAT